MMGGKIKLKRPKRETVQMRVKDRLAKDAVLEKDWRAIGLAQKLSSQGFHLQKLRLQRWGHGAIAAIMPLGNQQDMPLDQGGMIGQQEEGLAFGEHVLQVLAGTKRTIFAGMWYFKRGLLLQTHELVPRH
jgi:hypothetical protein